MEKGLYIRSSRLLKDAIHLAMNDTLNFLATQESTFDGRFRSEHIYINGSLMMSRFVCTDR